MVACWLPLLRTFCIMRHPSPRPLPAPLPPPLFPLLLPAVEGGRSEAECTTVAAEAEGESSPSHTCSPAVPAMNAWRREAGMAKVSSTADPRAVWRSGRVTMASRAGGSVASAAVAREQQGCAPQPPPPPTPDPSSTGAPSEPEKHRASSRRSAGGVCRSVAAADVGSSFLHPLPKCDVDEEWLVAAALSLSLAVAVAVAVMEGTLTQFATMPVVSVLWKMAGLRRP